MRRSIRNQLLAWLLLMLAGLFFVRLFLAYWQTAEVTDRLYDEILLNSADSLAARLEETGKVQIQPESLKIFTHNHQDALYFEIFDQSGKRLAGDTRLLDSPPILRQLPAEEFSDITRFGQKLRMVRTLLPVPEQGLGAVFVVVAETMNARKKFFIDNLMPIIWSQLLVAAGSVLIVWICIDKAFQPLSRLAATILSRPANDLTEITDDTAPLEVQPFLSAFNTMCSRLREDFEARERFISNAAHQLRTPIAALKTYSSFGCTLDNLEELKHIVSKVDSSLDLLTRLVNQLLTLARVEGMVASPQFEVVDLNCIVSDVLPLLTVSANNKKLNLHFSPCADPSVLLGEQTSLQQLVTSLVENAIQYSPANSNIFVSVSDTYGACLTVEDEGPGIPPQERKRVFDRFYRVPGAPGSGSGLGLSIVKEVAMVHHADVRIANPLRGQGTIVSVSFPRAPANSAPDHRVSGPKKETHGVTGSSAS